MKKGEGIWAMSTPGYYLAPHVSIPYRAALLMLGASFLLAWLHAPFSLEVFKDTVE